MNKYQDHYFHKAKKENYPARSVYKLKEIDNKFNLFSRGQKVLDLGAAPGSWSIGASEKVGLEGLVISADIKQANISFPANVSFMQEDVFNRSPEFEALLEERGPFDIVMSDMAPKTTGHKGTDQARSAALCEEALAVALLHLADGGTFIAKIFMGPDFHSFMKDLRQYFNKVRSFKPKSSRSESYETFIIGTEYKGKDSWQI